MNLLWIVQAVLTFLEIAGAFWCVSVLLPASIDAGWKRAVFVAGCVVMTVLTIYHRSLVFYSRLYLLFCIVCCGIVGMVCSAGYRKKAAAVFAFYFETLYCLEIGFYILLTILCMWKDIPCDVQKNLTVGRVGVMLASRIVLAVFIWLLLCRWDRVKNYFTQDRKYWMLFPVMEHLCLLLCDVIVEEKRRGEAIRHGAGVLVLAPFLVLALILLGLYQKYKFLYQAAESQNQIYVRKWEERFQSMAEKERIYHDMKNHLILVRKLIQEGEPERAEDYIDKLIPLSIGRAEEEGGLGHPLLDYLVRAKKAEAVQKGIKITRGDGSLKIEFGEEELTDWCAMLGNLWDNAIEGCMRAEEPRRIHFSVWQAGNVAAVKIRNSCRADVDSRKLATEKREKGRHGVGMQSIRYVVNKYQGSIECNCENGVFEVDITLFLRER